MPYTGGFNPRPCARGDRWNWGFGLVNVQFQSTPLREGRQEVKAYSIQMEALFQSTPLREGRHVYAGDLYPVAMFQSTPLREGRRCSEMEPLQVDGGFNPRPCARGDFNNAQFINTPIIVSIHAPARGATR